MPRTAQATGFNQLQKQVRQILTTIKQGIRSKEVEIKCLKLEESQLTGLLSHQPRGGGATSNGKGMARTRTDWTAILGQLPKRFRAADVHKIHDLKDRRSSEIYAGLGCGCENFYSALGTQSIVPEMVSSPLRSFVKAL